MKFLLFSVLNFDNGLKNRDNILADSEIHIDTTESLECTAGWSDHDGPFNLTLPLIGDYARALYCNTKLMRGGRTNIDKSIKRSCGIT
jgi:hypothetical protein